MLILPEHKEILCAESTTRTLPEWVDFFEKQYKKDQIYNFCYKKGLKIKKLSSEDFSKIQSQNARKYHINQDYFKTWSHNMAYILGLWWADGCIYGGKMFDITMHNKDKYILKKVAEELQFEGKLYDYVDRQAARINFSCVVIYKDLIALGGSERKSMTIGFPEVPEEYLPDFIRGYFDGDGCITEVQGGRINSAFTSGSRKFLDGLLKVLREKAGIEGGSYDPSSYTIKFGKKDTIRLGQYMYGNNPELFLLRKRSKFNF